ncbi:MAG: hypothetical protein EOP86_16640 [Verrucomicrobiaceae bacterium]|nr:MAG: hypothetical protein EOP86_16640 [Verrucomicrobiaceae bacterium]
MAILAKQAWSAPGQVDRTFGPGLELNGRVIAMAVRPDGKILIAGDFTQAKGLPCRGMALLTAEGTADPNFHAAVEPAGTVFTLVLQPDGGILLGGEFTRVNGWPRHGLARLHPDGKLDKEFHPDPGSVSRVLLQPDGKIIVAADSILRLHADGSADPSFRVTVPGFLHALAPDGKVIIGRIRYNQGSSSHALVRLHPDGGVDPGFVTPAIDGTVAAFTFQPDGRLLIGGSFLSVKGVQRLCAARLNPNGSPDTGFDPGTVIYGRHFDGECAVTSIVQLPDGKVRVAGFMKVINDDVIDHRGFVIGLQADGAEDFTFAAVFTNSTFLRIAGHVDGKLLMCGGFVTLKNHSSDFKKNTTARRYLVRLGADGMVDLFGVDEYAGPNNTVRVAIPQPDGRILIGGDFTEAGGHTRRGIARLNPNGSLDLTFNPALAGNDPSVTAIALQADGRILIGGRFTLTAGGVEHKNVVRLEADGNCDPAFHAAAAAGDGAACIVLQKDGTVLAGGKFGVLPGTPGSGVIRLKSDGGHDASFICGTGAGDVRTAAPQADGKVIIGGSFESVNGVSRHGLARLLGDGGLDVSFNAGSGTGEAGSDTVLSLAVQADGKIIFTGRFFMFNGVSCKSIGRLHPDGILDPAFVPDPGNSTTVACAVVQPDGRVLIAGDFTQVNEASRLNLARLNADGTLDYGFYAGFAFGAQWVAPQPDGRVLVGGNFLSFNRQPLPYVARVLGLPFIVIKTGPLIVINGLPGFTIESSSAATAVVEASTDLFDWAVIGSLPVGTVPARFDDAGHSLFTSRFYRVSWQP